MTRIATLLPSATDIVCALGLEKSLVGISHSCDQPSQIVELPRLTSTTVPQHKPSSEIDQFVRSYIRDLPNADAEPDEDKLGLYELNMERLEQAAPDIIISQGLCDVCAVSTGDVQAALCSLSSTPTLIDLNPNTLGDVLADIQRVGTMLNLDEVAWQCVTALQQRIDHVADAYQHTVADKPRVAFLEWLIPPFNGGHWNPELVTLAGGEDLLGNPGKPSTTLSEEQLFDCNPDVLVIACCGFSVPRIREDIAICLQNSHWKELRAVREGRVYLADGQDYFARPSPSLVDALERLAVSLHPAVDAGLRVEAFEPL